jgi:CubicO group peptidase (beta-lactamase class C family)
MRLSTLFLSVLWLLVSITGCAGSKAVADRPSRLEMARAYSAEKSGDALLVWIDGELVLEDYPNDSYDPTEYHILTEATTLLAGLVALAAVDDGLLTLDEPVSETITEWKDDPEKSDVTVSELLHLTSGLEANDHRSVPTYEEAIAAPLVHAPGDAFRYGPTAYQVFGAMMDRKTDGGYLKHRILLPLGIPGGYWLTVNEPTADELAGGRGFTPRMMDGAQLTARQLGRIGHLLLQNGRWEGEVLIEDLRPLTQPSDAQPAYGMGVWRNAPMDAVGTGIFEQLPESLMLPRTGDRFIYDGAPPDLFMAAGRYNQRLYIIPSKQTVIVRLGRANLTWSDAAFLARLLDGRTSAPDGAR